jgi:hypothetical protein
VAVDSHAALVAVRAVLLLMLLNLCQLELTPAQLVLVVLLEHLLKAAMESIHHLLDLPQQSAVAVVVAHLQMLDAMVVQVVVLLLSVQSVQERLDKATMVALVRLMVLLITTQVAVVEQVQQVAQVMHQQAVMVVTEVQLILHGV